MGKRESERQRFDCIAAPRTIKACMQKYTSHELIFGCSLSRCFSFCKLQFIESKWLFDRLTNIDSIRRPPPIRICTYFIEILFFY